MDVHAFQTRRNRRRRPHAKPLRGFTLVELAIVVVVLAILVAGSVPGFGRIVSRHRAATAANDLIQAMALARSEALKRGRRVYLAPVGRHWRDGWAVFVDRNDDRLFDAPSTAQPDELIFLHAALPDSITVSNPSSATREPFTDVGAPPRTYLMFDGHGYPRQRNGAFNIGSLVITDRTGGVVTIRTICVAAYGRIRIVVDRPAC